MRKKFLAIMTATIISAPSLFAYHDQDIDHLTAGMPVVFMVTGLKFTPKQHSVVRTALQTWYASECFLSQRFSMDFLVDAEGKATIIQRWPTKESYVRDQKAVVDLNHPAGICGALAKLRMNVVKLAGVKPSDITFNTVTSIASSPR